MRIMKQFVLYLFLIAFVIGCASFELPPDLSESENSSYATSKHFLLLLVSIHISFGFTQMT